MDAKLRKWVCKVLPWFVGVLLTGLVSGTVLVTDGSIPVDLQGTQWMWLAAVMTVALPLWLAGYVANPQRIVRIVSESVEWMLMGFGALEALHGLGQIAGIYHNNPEASINTNPINYSVWRTNNNWEFTHFYLPFEQGYTEFYGKPRYFTRSNNSIIFHALKYNGYFILEKHGNPSFSSIIFNNPLPKNHSYRLMDVNKNHWQFLAETPFKINGYGIFEISSSGESEQLFSVDSSHKIYRNSSTNAKYLPINIIGTTNDSFIGYINDDYNLYQNLVRYGFKKADEKTDSILKNGGCSLIIYQMKK